MADETTHPATMEVEVSPERDVVTLTAIPEHVREIIAEYARHIDVVDGRVEARSYAPGTTFQQFTQSLEKELKSIILLSLRFASVSSGDIRLYLPSLIMEERIRSDATVLTVAIKNVLREITYPILKEIQDKIREFAKLEDVQLREKAKREIVEKFVMLVKSLKQTTIALALALLNIFSCRSLNLPPELRSSLVNMRVLGADISYSSIYRLLQAVKREEAKREVREVAKLIVKPAREKEVVEKTTT